MQMQVFRHRFGEGEDEDELLYEEGARDFFVSLTKTKDDSFIIISSNSKTTSEVRPPPSFKPT